MATWVVGDIHGCYDDFMNLLKNESIKEDDTIILIGDIIDRGPDSYKMIEWAMKNVTKDGRYQMVIGNHEDYIIQCFNNVCRSFEHGIYGKCALDFNKLSIENMYASFDFMDYMTEAGYYTMGSLVDIVTFFRKLPLIKDLFIKKTNGLTQEYIIAHAWYGPNLNRDDILFERDVDVYTGRLYNDYKPEHNEILVHGHTPVLNISSAQIKPVNEVFFREHSINIDCGCPFSMYNGNLAAIRLEDHKVIYAKKQEPITYRNRF